MFKFACDYLPFRCAYLWEYIRNFFRTHVVFLHTHVVNQTEIIVRAYLIRAF